MKYTTREIINRALKLTDFSNDYFVGNKELSNLLNDCWIEAYSILINKNDKTFLKSVKLKNYDTFPKDIYKINKIKDSENNILLKEQDYDIVNNAIELKSDITVTVEYYPEPMPLMLKSNETKEMDYPAITLWDNGYINANGIYTNDGINELSYSFSNSIILSNGFIQTIGTNIIRDFKLREISDVVLIEGNKITYDKVNIETDVENVKAIITNKSHSFFYILNDNGLYDMSGQLLETNFKPLTLYCRDDGLYFIDNNNCLFRYLGNVKEKFDNYFYDVFGILDDEYICCSKNSLEDSKKYKKGYGFDTILEVPNQLFWSFFAYSIAESLCAIVGKDATAITNKKNELRELFNESLEQDNNSSYQIQNVENNRLW